MTWLVRRSRRALVRARWRLAGVRDRSRLVAGPPVVELARVRRRLELLLSALHDRPLTIEAVDPPAAAGWFRRYVLHSAGRRAASAALSRHEGDRILLPRALHAADGEAAAVARYRVLALQQAERIVRGTAAHLPADATPLVRDLYLLGEAVAIDRRTAATGGEVPATLRALRTAALARRPPLATLTGAERAVERLVRRALTADLAGLPPAAETPAGSLAWALETAARIGPGRRYRGVRPAAHWGAWRAAPVADGRTPVLDEGALRPASLPLPLPAGLPRAEGEGAGGRDADAALTTGQGSAGTPSVEHPAAARWARDDGEAGADGASASGEAAPEVERRHSRPPEDLPDDESHWRDDGPALETEGAGRPAPGTPYPEWDHVTRRYHEGAVMVRGGAAAQGDSSWAHTALAEHAALVRSVRQRFGRLSARRVRHRQQRHGEELDLAACVQALVERRAGHAPDDRLYQATRTTRPPFAIALLADVSGSTREAAAGALRMIDVEKLALLLAGEALAALGDRYALLAFAGHGAHDVRVATLKAFGEANGEPVRRRIAALQPGGFTRLGAAVRHATALLSREPARHRLLLVLSDGRPNDLGHYVAGYGVEDSRQAIHEARARAIYPFCLNVDRDRPEYLAHIFGPAGYATLRRPEQLPRALLRAVRVLIGG